MNWNYTHIEHNTLALCDPDGDIVAVVPNSAVAAGRLRRLVKKMNERDRVVSKAIHALIQEVDDQRVIDQGAAAIKLLEGRVK